MIKALAVAALSLMALATTSPAADQPATPLAPGPVEVTGKLRTGIMAIGGETTGTILSIPGQGTYELDLSGNAELQKSAEALSGQPVKVKGTLAIKAGVEVKERRIIKVDRLEAAGVAEKK